MVSGEAALAEVLGEQFHRRDGVAEPMARAVGPSSSSLISGRPAWVGGQCGERVLDDASHRRSPGAGRGEGR